MTTPPDPPLTKLGQALVEVDELKDTVGHLTDVLNTERATTRRFRVNIAVLVILTLLNTIGLGFNYRAAREAKDVGDTLSDCLVVGGDCYERLARSGMLGSNRLMDFNACFFLIEPATRTAADTEKCRKKADDNFFAKLKEVEPN